jgi:gamma-glutamyltranspeptidase
MAPLILVNAQGLPVLVSGASGGQKIISALISTTWRALYRALNLKEAIDYPRFIPQFNPSQLMYEYGLPNYVVAELRRKGHTLVRLDSGENGVGNVNGVCRTKQTQLILANADYRKHGDSAGF